MGLSFLSLLFLQVSYIEEMMRTRREQFDESVQRSLDQACRNLELAETRNYLEADAIATEAAAQKQKALDGHIPLHLYKVPKGGGGVAGFSKDIHNI